MIFLFLFGGWSIQFFVAVIISWAIEHPCGIVLAEPWNGGCQKRLGTNVRCRCLFCRTSSDPQTSSRWLCRVSLYKWFHCLLESPRYRPKKEQKHLNTRTPNWTTHWFTHVDIHDVHPSDTRRCELQQMELQVHSWLREAWVEGLMAEVWSCLTRVNPQYPTAYQHFPHEKDVRTTLLRFLGIPLLRHTQNVKTQTTMLSGCLDAPTSLTLDLAAGCRHPHGGKDGLQPTLQPQPCSGHAWKHSASDSTDGMPPFFCDTPAYQCIHGADLQSVSEDSSIDWGGTVNSAETLLKRALLSASSPFACEVLVRPFRIFPMKESMESHHKSWKTRPKIRRPTTEASHLLVSRGASHCVDLCGTTLMVWVKLLKIREWQIWIDLGCFW